MKDPRQAIAAIQRNAQMQAKLIEDLLEMNKLASGTVRLELVTVSICVAVVEAAVQALKPTADAKGVKLSPSSSHAVPEITADGRPAAADPLEPAAQRHQVHAGGRAGPGHWRDTRPIRAWTIAVRTPVRGSRRTFCRSCSIGSGRPTRRPPAAPGAWVSGSRSRSTSSSCTAAPFRPPSPGPGLRLDVPRALAVAEDPDARLPEPSGGHGNLAVLDSGPI